MLNVSGSLFDNAAHSYFVCVILLLHNLCMHHNRWSLVGLVIIILFDAFINNGWR
jgi:hypothetical protein